MVFLELGVWREIERALPAIDGAKGGISILQLAVERGGFGGPPGGAVLVRHVEPEFVLIILDRFERGVLDRGILSKAPRIETPGIIAGFAMRDDLREQPAMAAAFTEAGAQAGDAVGVAFAGDAADQRQPVGRVGDRAIDDGVDAGGLQAGQAAESTFQHIGDPIQIIGAQRHGEILIDAVQAPGFAGLFVKADEQALFLRPAIEVVGRAADQRHAKIDVRDRFDGLGEHILMLHRGHGQAAAHHGGDFIAAVAAGIDDFLGSDIAILSVDQPGAVRFLGEPGHGIEALDFGPGFAGAAGQGLAELGWVNIAIQRVPQRAQEIIGGDQRVAALAFGWIKQLEFDAHAFGLADEMVIAVKVVLRRGKAQPAGRMVVIDWIIGIVSELFIEFDRVGFQPQHGLVGAEIGDLSG